jgi:hypothetical protein
VNAEASVRRSGCAAAARSSISESFSRCSPPQPRSRARPCSSRELWLAEHPVEDLDGSTQGNPIIVRGKQESQTDDRPIEKLGLGEILKLLDLELFAKILAPAELLSACVAPLRAILASELMGFGAVLEQGGRGGLIALRRAVREPTLVWPMLWEIASCA